jgi:hypothetical protein
MKFTFREFSDAGLVEGGVLSENRGGRQIPSAYFITRMTMAGHDFLGSSLFSVGNS